MSQQTFETLLVASILVPLMALLWLEFYVWVKKLKRERDLWFGCAIRSAFRAEKEATRWDWPKR